MSEDKASYLAARAYMYQLLHVVFGAVLTREALERLAGDTTLEVLAYWQDAQNESASPSCFENCAKTLEAISAEGVSEGTVDELATSYTRLFMVPGDDYVRPWESPYRDKEVMLFQESTLDVRNRYRAYDFEAVGYKHFPEDHIAMMLHFLGVLSTKAYDANEAGRVDEVQQILADQRSFIKEHLTRWRPKFVEALELKDHLGFYLAFARVLDAFIAEDVAQLEEATAE